MEAIPGYSRTMKDTRRACGHGLTLGCSKTPWTGSRNTDQFPGIRKQGSETTPAMGTCSAPSRQAHPFLRMWHKRLMTLSSGQVTIPVHCCVPNGGLRAAYVYVLLPPPLLPSPSLSHSFFPILTTHFRLYILLVLCSRLFGKPH